MNLFGVLGSFYSLGDFSLFFFLGFVVVDEQGIFLPLLTQRKNLGG